MRRAFFGVMVLALSVTACGGAAAGDETSTTGPPAETTTTTVETTTTQGQDSGGPIGLEDVPQECIDAFVGFLEQMEPILEGIDWENATIADLEGLSTQLEPLANEYEATIGDTGCDELDLEQTDESFDYLIDLARDEAPGTVGYLEWIRDFADGAGQEASGDCDTDISTLEAIIADGGTMQDLALGQLSYVGSLISSVSFNCSPEVSAEFLSRPEVQAFIGGGG